MTDFLNALGGRLAETFDPSVLGETLATWSTNLIFAVLTFGLYYAVWRVLWVVLPPLLARMDVDETGRRFVKTVARLLILTLGAVAALGEVGINTASLLASVGVAGLTVGFAARDALSNIISGIFIFWDRPFVIGDLIEVGDKYGRVENITLRSTRVVTVDGRMLAIPNAEVVNSSVVSYTNFPNLRLDVPVTVGVGEDLARVRQLLLSIVTDDPDYMDDRTPEVVVAELNDFNVKVVLRAWIKDERTHVAKRFELRERMFETLRSAGVDMPFETINSVVIRPDDLARAS